MARLIGVTMVARACPVQHRRHKSKCLQVAACLCVWHAERRRQRQLAAVCYWWLTVMASCAAAGMVHIEAVHHMSSLFRSLFQNRRMVGALRRLAEYSNRGALTR